MHELSRREREKLNRRNEILEASKKIFSEKGYDNATVDDVASAAELSKGTIYLYFQNKSDLFVSTIEMGMEQLASLVLKSISNNSEDPIAGIRDIIYTQLSFCEENMDLFKMISSDSVHIEIHSQIGKKKEFQLKIMGTMSNVINALAEYIQMGIDKGLFKIVNPVDAAFTLLSVIRGFVFSWIMESKKGKLKDKADIIITIFLDGMKRIESN